MKVDELVKGKLYEDKNGQLYEYLTKGIVLYGFYVMKLNKDDGLLSKTGDIITFSKREVENLIEY